MKQQTLTFQHASLRTESISHLGQLISVFRLISFLDRNHNIKLMYGRMSYINMRVLCAWIYTNVNNTKIGTKQGTRIIFRVILAQVI